MKMWHKLQKNRFPRLMAILLFVSMCSSCTNYCWPHVGSAGGGVGDLAVGAIYAAAGTVCETAVLTYEGLNRSGVDSDERQFKDLQMARRLNQFKEVELAYATRKNAEAGDIGAQYELYFMGLVPEAEQNYWLCVAANHGHSMAQVEMGRLSWYGIGSIEENRSIGFMWYSLAARSGLERGEIEVAERRPLLTPPEIARSNQLIKDWVPKPEECKGQSHVDS